MQIFFEMRILLAAFTIICGTITGNAANLLINGDFSSPEQSGKIPGWIISRELARQDVRVVKIAGQSCVQIETTEPTKRSGALSQRVKVKPNCRYVFTVYLKRDSFVYGTAVSVNIPLSKKKILRNKKLFRSENWEPVSIAFNTKSGSSVTVCISTPNTGTWRITKGRKLWIRNASLSEISLSKNITISNVKLGKNSVKVNLPATAPYYVWAKVYIPGKNRFSLDCGNQRHTFYGYTLKKWYWVRPILPDFILKAGERKLTFTVDGKGVKVKELLLTMDQFYRPPGATKLRPSVPGQGSGGIPSVKVKRAELQLKVDRKLPLGKWGITQGVPFPQGALPTAANVNIKDRTFQASVLSKWPDGSVRWLLLSTLASSKESMRIEYGSEVKAKISGEKREMLKKQGYGSYLVSTGKIKFNVSSNPKALITNLQNKSLSLIFNNKLLTAKAVIKVEESGPVRVVLKISGKCNDSFSYILRIFAYVGADNIELEHQLINYSLSPAEAIDCGFKITGKFKQAEFMPSRKKTASAVPVRISTLVKSTEAKINLFPYIISSQSQELAKGKYAQGLVVLDSTMTVAVRDFWRNSPSEIAVEAEQAIINLYQGKILFDSGMSRTRRVMLGVSANSNSARVFLAHPLLMASSEWYCDSRAFYAWPLSAPAAKAPLYENSVAKTIDFWQKREKSAMHRANYKNMLYSGELPYGKGDCLNMETAMGEGILTQFLRTGNRKYYNFAERLITHYADVDINHSNGEFRGRVLKHGPFIRKKLGHRANGHSWYGGVSLYGLFTGERSILDMAQAVGQYHAEKIPAQSPETFIHYWRQPAWQLMAILHAWTACNDNKMLSTAQRLVKLTRTQQDYVVSLWPYMFSIGMKGLRMYYEIIGDPVVRELYLQMTDAYMYLRQRPGDTSFGEPPKAPGMLLGNYPNDRSCCFFNLTAHADWLAQRVKYVPLGGKDMDLQLQYSINDPTFLWGSADLLRGMRQDKVKLSDHGAMTLPILMHVSEAKSPAGKLPGPLTVFQVNDRNDQAFSLNLYSAPYKSYKYSHKIDCYALLYAPDGKLLKADSFSTYGMNQYKFAVPRDGKRGIYTLIISVKKPWRWTIEHLPFELKAGKHSLKLRTRYDRMLIDALCFALVGKFNPNAKGAVFLEAENTKHDKNYIKLSDHFASGKIAVRKITGKTSLEYIFDIPKTGTYLFYARVFKGAPDLMEIKVDKGKSVICSQTHDMTRNSYTCWLLSSSLGQDSIIPTWGTGKTSYSGVTIFNSKKLKPSPAFSNAEKYLNKQQKGDKR